MKLVRNEGRGAAQFCWRGRICKIYENLEKTQIFLNTLTKEFALPNKSDISIEMMTDLPTNRPTNQWTERGSYDSYTSNNWAFWKTY